ncbi:GNAT family N-acetyltransferase [Dyadobacter sandarakinus]|uniref:GNAT family N-acetyltransferase n=1 Tax=Dyadobacter sandarakinus TaxID=2747268 RepID=A0ABX7I420_9BACT|nr:GNAT family N-acetyltransferase [Dyadobacter sandarakinus]QRR00844.1 GNAT family N-acetyltransferase [Dyadobacter sandarakinus]
MTLNLKYRLAIESDLTKIIEMLLDDSLGALRENAGTKISPRYIAAFKNIQEEKNHELTIVELDGEIVGTYHLTFIQYLTHQGGLRAQIEAVRVGSLYRGKGIGRQMLNYAIDRARSKGCYLVQLTTDKRRPEALKFYYTLGFVDSHEGMKLNINNKEH